jgi:hypothetical protein
MASIHFAAQRAELDREAADLRAALDTAVRTKSVRALDALEKRVHKLAADRKELDRQEAAITTGKFAALRQYGGDFGSQPTVVKNGRENGPGSLPIGTARASS